MRKSGKAKNLFFTNRHFISIFESIYSKNRKIFNNNQKMRRIWQFSGQEKARPIL